MEGIDPGLVAMLKDDKGTDNTMLILLLLLLGGRRGLGGEGDNTCCPPSTLEQLTNAQTALTVNATQNANAAELQRQAGIASVTERTLDITRDQAANAFRNETGQRDLQAAIANSINLVQAGQKDIQAAIAACCCETQKEIVGLNGSVNLQGCETRNTVNVQGLATQNAIEKCCCELGNGMAMQTNVLSQAICNDGDKTRALIQSIERDQLQSQLTDAKLANSNLNQTVTLTEQIRNACCQPCQPCHPHHPYGGNGGPPGPPFGNVPA